MNWKLKAKFDRWTMADRFIVWLENRLDAIFNADLNREHDKIFNHNWEE